MSELRNIVFIPQWVAEGIQRNKENLSVVLDPSKLKEFISLDDMVGLVALNNSLGEVLGFNINLSIGNGLSNIWQMSHDEATKDYIANVLYPNITSDTASKALERLLANEEYNSDIDNFDTLDLSRDCSAIILKYGFFNTLRKDVMEYKLIESILQILYVYHPHHLIASTDIGGRYLELLSLYQN